MTKEEARATYRRLRDEIGCYDAIRNSPEFYDIVCAAIGYLMESPENPWVKTADRLPTEVDANKESRVLGWDATLGYRDVDYKFVVTYPRFIPWWMPILSLPEDIL